MRRRFCRTPTLGGGVEPEQPTPTATTAQPTLPLAAPPSAPRRRRILALHLPLLMIERLRLPGPLAVWTMENRRQVVLAVDPAAAAVGLQPGQALADAQQILPGVALRPAEPEADAAWLRRLALWSLCVTPLPAVDVPDGLLLDITGAAHLHGGEKALLHAVTTRFARAGVTVRGAIAGTPDAAAALARAGRHGAVVPAGGEATAIAPLPLASLRLPHPTIATLHRLGLRSVGAVLQQPRGPLARRFGVALTDALDAATGARPQPIRPLRPPPDFAAAREFLEPIVTREAIDATLDRLLPVLCGELEKAGQGARRLVLLAFRVDGGVQEVAVGTGLPSRDPAHFARLFREKLERLSPGFGFERLALEARSTEAMTVAQAALPGRRDSIARADNPWDLAQLLDRLSQRLAVWRLAPRASHWPERAVQRVGVFDPVALPTGWNAAPRPLRLLRRPLALQAMAMLPDGPPLRLRAGQASWR
ncbi:MAG TPA: DNA polymerase Y family protein, partial [Acetobacteraceae bacterium]|nr:DNA polymerase Y family protein [Acetobacteraceae bacterium]